MKTLLSNRELKKMDGETVWMKGLIAPVTDRRCRVDMSNPYQGASHKGKLVDDTGHWWGLENNGYLFEVYVEN